MWEENGFIFWQFPGKRERGGGKLLDHSLALGLCQFEMEREREKIPMEELVPCFDVPGVADPPEQCLLTLNSEAVCAGN